jgi:8-oxo-dGTP diphosphatase
MESWKESAYTALIVFGYLVRGNRVLLIRRANEPYRGQRTVPGGRKRPGETLRQAVAREILEETGYTLRSTEYAGMLHAMVEGQEMEYLSVYFLSRDFEGEARSGDEGTVEWADIDESMTMEDMHPTYLRLLPYILKGNYPVEGSVRVFRDGRSEYLLSGPGERIRTDT